MLLLLQMKVPECVALDLAGNALESATSGHSNSSPSTLCIGSSSFPGLLTVP